jgi:hypothetical protein
MIELGSDERLVLTARKHWLIFISEIVGTILTTLIIFSILAVADVVLPRELVDSLGTDRLIALNMVLIGAILLIANMILATAFTNFYLDTLIVTDKRLVDCDQKGLFKRDVATIPIENVIDIKVEIFGIIQTFLKFGTLYIQTAGDVREVVIKGIRDPQSVKDTIISTYHKDAREQVSKPI